MKIQNYCKAEEISAMKQVFTHETKHRGFALVVTLSLMILLTIIAVGLLSLSAISLRSSSQGMAQAEARANARLALMLAIGDLQKYAGIDKAVTAPIELTQENPQMPRLTGVWGSWDQFKTDGQGAPDYESTKNGLFRSWLVSDPNSTAVTNRGYDGPSGETIRLVGAGTLGTASPAPMDIVEAGRVPLFDQAKKPTGALAWHVSDESCKARINAYRDPETNDYPWRKSSLLAGHRPDASVVKAADGTSMAFLPGDDAAAWADKLVSAKQFELLPGGESFGRFHHHVTPYSYGLLTDVRHGGLKQDLSTMFESASLPAPYNGAKLYESTLGVSGASDPNWAVLAEYSSLGKEPLLTSSDPVYRPAQPEAVTLDDGLKVPSHFNATPVIARVEMIFSVVAREALGMWGENGNRGIPGHTRLIHLLYTPMITLHNPYNVKLEFDRLDIDIAGIPIGFNFFVNGLPKNTSIAPYNTFFSGEGPKSFYISVADWSSPARIDTNDSTSGKISMNPGQSMVCGPFINGDATFGIGNVGVFFDYYGNATQKKNRPAKCKPGFLGKQIGFDTDQTWSIGHPAKKKVLQVKPTDRLRVECQMLPNSIASGDINEMTVNATLTSNGTATEIGGLEFKFDSSKLNGLYPEIFSSPPAGDIPSDLLVEDLLELNDTPIRDQVRVRPVALLSARARTANGGVYDSISRDKQTGAENLLTDGILAGIPLLHHNPARTPTVVDLRSDQPGRYSHELSLGPLNGSVDDIFDIDATNRGYLLTANKNTDGIKSGSYLELPTGPLQTIADFRRSNALASPMLPTFVQPVANSYSSPLIPTDKIIEPGAGSYDLLDHSVLANHALYDRFYFSTFSTYGSTTPDHVFSGFMDGSRPLAAQAYEPHLPSGTTAGEARQKLFNGSIPSASAYREAAGYQLVRTPFNVNSVDPEAWKAVLSAMKGDTIQQLWAASGARHETPAEKTPLLPMSLVNGGAIGSYNPADFSNIDNERTNDFNGYRDLEPDQVDRLAKAMVDQVRARGPFLSLSEFVNRQIGTSSDKTLTGALQAAIEESGINDGFLDGHVIPVREEDVEDTNVYDFPNVQASTGNSAAGAPGWLMQGDLMRLLEPGATVRGDTFVIRTSGQSVNASGNVEATAYAEAVVQRLPEYIDPADSPSTNVWDSSTVDASAVNRRFGRRFVVVSFRWLSSGEI